MPTRWVALIVLVAAILAAIGALQASNWSPSVPPSAASTNIARATPSNGHCLDRITNGSGWLDLCWEAYQLEDGDAVKDYYALRVYGTASGEGSGIRWWRVRANLAPDAAQTADGVFEGWPDGTYEGPCRAELLPLSIANATGVSESVCGGTTGEFVGTWGHQVTWTCEGCLLNADHSAREVVLYESVGVSQGSIPAWDIGADFGQ